jgi:branched-chain amino acid transport system ATP-binding protein
MSALIELSNVTVYFGGVQALSGVNFSMEAGEVVAAIGPNGAGKTSLFNSISGFVPLTRGEILFEGARIDGLTPHEISARGVRRTFQNGGLFPELSVLENVLAGLHAQIKTGIFGTLVGARAALRKEREGVAKARQLLELMDLGQLEDQLARDLSGGQQRMVEIVRAVATSPPLLLLDEPAVGLAPPVREQLCVMIRRLAGEGVGVLLIEHAIELVMSVSDRIIVLNYGEKIADGEPEAVRADKQVLESYLGHA